MTAHFGEIAAVIHSMVFKEGSHSSRIDIVLDTYRNMSINNVERTLRVDDQGLQLQNISETQLAKQWKKFFRQSYNKASTNIPTNWWGTACTSHILTNA